MKISQATQRIFWRFGGNDNKKPFPVTEQDIEAYNVIVNYVKEAEKKQFEANELFAKMFVFTYMRILENDQSTVFDNMARKKIYNLLKKPLFQIVEDFRDSLNDSENYGLMRELDINYYKPLSDDECIAMGVKKGSYSVPKQEQTTEDAKKIIEAIKKPENKDRFLREVWRTEDVSDLIEAEINQAINLFK